MSKYVEEREKSIVNKALYWAKASRGMVTGSVAAWLQGVKLQLRDADIITEKKVIIPGIKEERFVQYGNTVNTVIVAVQDGVGVEIVVNPVAYSFLKEKAVDINGVKVASLHDIYAMKLVKLALSISAPKTDIIWHQAPKTIADLLILWEHGIDLKRVKYFIEFFEFKDVVDVLKHSHLALEVQMGFTIAAYYLAIYDHEEVMERYRDMMRDVMGVLGI